jgi:hypothetical protein
MITPDQLSCITQQYTNIPADIMQQWIDILSPKILPHWRTSHAVANFYIKTFALCAQKLQHTYPNASNETLTPVALTKTLQRLSASAAIPEHAAVFTELWNARKPELMKQITLLDCTNPWRMSK